jgi:hypothetical protein
MMKGGKSKWLVVLVPAGAAAFRLTQTLAVPAAELM